MVFSLNTLRVCKPYWSCEGHNDNLGKPFRLPQVWFYSSTSLYPKLIAAYLTSLKGSKSIRYSWQITLSYTDSHFDRGYAIQPLIGAGTVQELAHLQNDIQVIADGLWDGVMSIAGEWEEKAEHLLNRSA